MKKNLLFFVVSAFSLLTLMLAGCSKKDSGSSYSMASIAGTYKLTSATYTAGGVTQDGMDLFFDPCQQDDILQFKADSTFIYTDAGTTCSTDGSGTGKWYISGNYLIQTEDQNNDTATIKSFNGTALTLTTPVDLLGVPVIFAITMTKQ
ncbi:MAG TPA: lipocalin family protein [Puia sp.]|nr:lipocalin family protein [Puia sp.]